MTDAYNIHKRWRVLASYRCGSKARAVNVIELDMLRRLYPPSGGRAA